jgi:hypothetical protein
MQKHHHRRHYPGAQVVIQQYSAPTLSQLTLRLGPKKQYQRSSIFIFIFIIWSIRQIARSVSARVLVRRIANDIDAFGALVGCKALPAELVDTPACVSWSAYSLASADLMIPTSHVIAAVDFVDLDVATGTHASDSGRLELVPVSNIGSVSLSPVGLAIERREMLVAFFFGVTLVLRVTLLVRVSLFCGKAFAGTALFTSLSVVERDVAS